MLHCSTAALPGPAVLTGRNVQLLWSLPLLFKGIQRGSQEKRQETLCLAGENMACYKFQAIFADKDKFISAGISIITPERATLSYVFEKCKRSTSPQVQLLFVPRQLFSSLPGPGVHPSALCSLPGASEISVSARSSPCGRNSFFRSQGSCHPPAVFLLLRKTGLVSAGSAPTAQLSWTLQHGKKPQQKCKKRHRNQAKILGLR